LYSLTRRPQPGLANEERATSIPFTQSTVTSMEKRLAAMEARAWNVEVA
jgi:hypothetical protein